MSPHVPLDVHRHESGELHEARIDTPHGPPISPRDEADEMLAEPRDGAAGGKLVDLRRADASIDRARHQRHAAWLGRMARTRIRSMP
jgi:hypothetical protein